MGPKRKGRGGKGRSGRGRPPSRRPPPPPPPSPPPPPPSPPRPETPRSPLTESLEPNTPPSPSAPKEERIPHPVFGPCPWEHAGQETSGFPGKYSITNCTCKCQQCRRKTSRREALFKDGRFNGPGRMRFPTPGPGPRRTSPSARDNVFDSYTHTRNLDESIQAEMSRIAGDFGRRRNKETARNFPKDEASYRLFTVGLHMHPCTEKIPWQSSREHWEFPCPNDRRGLEDPGKLSAPCVTAHRECRLTRMNSRQFLNASGVPEDPDDIAFVCEDHRQDSKDYLHVEDLYRAHLVGTCADCRDRLRILYPDGENTCTCKNLLNKWTCRACLEVDVKSLQNHFRRRVNQSTSWTVYEDQGGRADREMLRDKRYHWAWQDVRSMLAAEHPCSHYCGKKRLLKNEVVMDCRACGGKIVQAGRPRTRRAWNPLVELTFGRGKKRGGEEQAIRRQPDTQNEAMDFSESGVDDELDPSCVNSDTGSPKYRSESEAPNGSPEPAPPVWDLSDSERSETVHPGESNRLRGSDSEPDQPGDDPPDTDTPRVRESPESSPDGVINYPKPPGPPR